MAAERHRGPGHAGSRATGHWVIDDTGWDHGDPAGSINRILRDAEEADAIRALVTEIDAVSKRRPPGDADWFNDSRRPEVRELAAAAVELMRRPT